MKILIVNGYVRENKGDAALMSVLSRQLQNIFPDSIIMVSGMEDPLIHPDFEGFKNVGSMHLYADGVGLWRPHKIARKIFLCIITAIWPTLPGRFIIAKILPDGMRGELLGIEGADMVVSMGGGYIIGSKSMSGNLNILFQVLPLRLAERLGKIVVLGPQSFGPFENSWQRRIVLKTLNKSRLICVREDKSYEILKKIGVRKDLMYRTIDSGFAYGEETISYPQPKDGVMRVGITARKWLKGNKQLDYEKALADFIINIQNKHGAQVILIPQVSSNYNADDDRMVNKRINTMAIKAGAQPIKIVDDIDLWEIKNLYSTLTFTVGTRFHSVIFSLTSYVPVIAIEYEHKTSGIMHDLDLDKWVIPIEDVTGEKLGDLFSRLVANREDYIRHLKSILLSYIKRANEVPFLIKQAYEKESNNLP